MDLETERQALQEALAKLEESRNHYTDMYDHAPVGHVVLDNRGCIREINLTGAALIGGERSWLIGMPMAFFVVKSDLKLFLDHLLRCKQLREKVITELGLATKNGAPTQVQLLSIPHQNDDHTQYETVLTDITEQKRMEKELSLLYKLNLEWAIAADMAHEIRNPMTTVRGFLQLFREKNEFARYWECFDIMIEELDQTNAIITKFLSLTENKTIDLHYKNLNGIIKDILPLLQANASLTGKNVQLALGDIPNLLLDEKEIRRLIHNFARNGLQAMPDGGTLTLKTYPERAEVVLAVQDQGKGVTPGALEKMGTPFFTTKEKSKVLGLAVCYQIAARHNAMINVETSPSGTTFFIRFKHRQT
ncbi:MAG: PAS domain S-box protein [Peptococcaceae bacterium]|nr:MAG: PAS domain S-box protein [Peptococcaceae bacterium]